MRANGNPFIGEDSDRVIVSIDTLAGDRMFARLQEPEVVPYDLVVFDEAHKLSADRGTDLRVRKTDRYRLAEALAGVPAATRLAAAAGRPPPAPATATPHMGKDYPYYALWRLLEPEVLSTPDAFKDYPRRTPRSSISSAAPRRKWSTSTADRFIPNAFRHPRLRPHQGQVSEQKLYDDTTDYLRHVYNKAKLLNRSAARLAMSVFQRRLASSTYALLRSFERRMEKLDDLIERRQEGRLTMEQLDHAPATDSRGRRRARHHHRRRGRLRRTARKQNEAAEDTCSRRRRRVPRRPCRRAEQVTRSPRPGRQVYDAGTESKFERLRELLTDPRYTDEKFIVFTEHRDTSIFLVAPA